MKDLAQADFRRILIIKPSSPGDILHALPVLYALRERFPQAHLAWLVAAPFVNLIETISAIDEVIPFDRRRFARVGRSMRISAEFWSFVGQLRRRHFDLALDLQGLFRSGFLAWASGARARIGFAAARESAWIFYTHKLPSGPPERHAAEKNYDAARLLGAGGDPMRFELAIRDADVVAAQAMLQSAQAGDHSRYVVLAPAARWETKRWPPEKFGQLALRLKSEFSLMSVLIGAESDREAGDLAAAASAGSAVNLCGRTTLRQLAALVNGAALVVSNDSTPMHLAAALDRPLVALFGPTNPLRTGPFGRIEDVLRLPLDCAPCYLRHMKQCTFDHACMRDLSVDRVFQAASTRLAAADRKA